DDRDCPVGSSGGRLREDDGREGALTHGARHEQRRRSECASTLIDRELTADEQGEGQSTVTVAGKVTGRRLGPAPSQPNWSPPYTFLGDCCRGIKPPYMHDGRGS